VGELEFNFLLRNYFIKSKNLLSVNTISIKQIEGPFESFDGEWKVSEIDNQNTEVTFKAEFQLPFLLNNLLPDRVIDDFCKVAIEAFVDRVTKE
jgi:ribosome-associated toxin RatA of RatAB toxin-antitoxin module